MLQNIQFHSAEVTSKKPGFLYLIAIFKTASPKTIYGTIKFMVLKGSSNTVRTNGVNQVFRLVKGIWLHRKCQIRSFFYFTYFWATILQKYYNSIVHPVITCITFKAMVR